MSEDTMTLQRSTAEAIYNRALELKNFALDTRDIVLDRYAAFQIIAKDLGIDLLKDEETFLRFISYIGDMHWKSGILEPIDDKIIYSVVGYVMRTLFGEGWFEKLKSRVGMISIVDDEIVISG